MAQSIVLDFRIFAGANSLMTTVGRQAVAQWNKYEATAARRHGRPGREVRPGSVTIDVHSHVAYRARRHS